SRPAMTGGRVAPGRQLPLGLPHRPAMTRADFLVGDANRAAIDLIDRWPSWPAPVVALVGPKGSGKSHLVEIWAAASGALITTAARAGEDRAAQIPAAIAVEDLHDPGDEAAL